MITTPHSNAALPENTFQWRIHEIETAVEVILAARIWKEYCNVEYRHAFMKSDDVMCRRWQRSLWDWIQLEKTAQDRLKKSLLTLQLFHAY